MTDLPEPRNRSGGGIVFGGGTRSPGRDGAAPAHVAAALRRRWASGIAVVTAVDSGGGLRGVTVSSLMIVSEEPPLIAVALTAASSFQELTVDAATLGISLLDTVHEFPAERFAGRAPLPDANFTGVRHRIESGAPILHGSTGWCLGQVRQRQDLGDHVLILLEIVAGDVGPDSDDPLLSYEGRYRRLEAG